MTYRESYRVRPSEHLWLCVGCRFLVIANMANLVATNGTAMWCGCKRGKFRQVQEPWLSKLLAMHEQFLVADEAAVLLGQEHQSSSPIHTIFRDKAWVQANR